ncbi:MAG: hypothetical protein LBQ41_00240 [Candidatus Ancillula sp.]|jgi:hypothetical protein|nr:hypothetical protein [Candidatus Ancillula sp.]
MFKLLFKKLKPLGLKLFGNLRRRLIRNVLVILLLAVLLLIPVSLLGSMLSMSDAISSISAKNWTSAVSKLENSGNMLGYENWKLYFNSGVAYYQLDQQVDARDSFNQARSLIENSNDISDICSIDVNLSYSIERSGELLATRTDQPATLRSAAQLYLQAFISRTQIASNCSILGEDPMKMNATLLEEDKDRYSKLLEEAHSLDGQMVDNEIDQKLNDQEINKLSDQSIDNSIDSIKLQELYATNKNAQEDYQKGQDAVKPQEGTTLRPW